MCAVPQSCLVIMFCSGRDVRNLLAYSCNMCDNLGIDANAGTFVTLDPVEMCGYLHYCSHLVLFIFNGLLCVWHSVVITSAK